MIVCEYVRERLGILKGNDTVAHMLKLNAEGKTIETYTDPNLG